MGTLRGANYNNYLYVPIDLQQVTQRIEGVKMLKLDIVIDDCNLTFVSTSFKN